MRKAVGLGLTLLLVTICISSFFSLSAASNTVLSIVPSAPYVTFPQSFILNVTVADVADLMAWQINVSYNPSIVAVINITAPPDEFFTAARGPNSTTGIMPQIRNDRGYTVAFNGLFDIVGVSGSGILCQIQLRTIKPGVTGLSFVNIVTFGGTYLSNSANALIPFTSLDGIVTVSTTGFQAYTYTATRDSVTYPVKLFTNSTPSNLQYTQTTREMTFTLTGTDGTKGSCSVVIPKPLLSGVLRIKLNGIAVWHSFAENLTAYYLDFTYSHSTVSVQIFETIIGDIDGDRKVSMMDVAIVCRAFGALPGNPYYDPRADVNRDGTINMVDIAIVGQNFNKVWVP